MQGGVERSAVDVQRLAGVNANGVRQAVRVLRAPLQRLQDQEVERALEQLDAGLGRARFCHGPRHSTSMALDCLVPGASAELNVGGGEVARASHLFLETANESHGRTKDLLRKVGRVG